MVLLKKVKKSLRKIVPAGRTYIDKKFEDQKENIFSEIKEQNIALEDELRSSLSESYTKQLKEMEKRILREMEDYFEQQEASHELQKKKTLEIQDQIGRFRKGMEREFDRRDNWQKMASEVERLAEGRQVWVIKCPATEGILKYHWGDYYYALALQKYLERKGRYVILDTRQDWGCDEGADVVLVLRGKYFYRPDRRNKKCLYIMWNISHPDQVSKAEYELYDVVCAGSRYFAEKLKNKIKVPVVPLLQCTDTELFCPEGKKDELHSDQYIFIGSTRGVMRDCVLWAVEDGMPLHVWGGGWKEMIPDHTEIIEGDFKENEKLPELYRAAKVTLNDHWKDMLEYQIINNRVFDALACGLPVISDGCPEMKEIFPDAVLYYETKEEFEACVQKAEKEYPSLKEKALEQFEMIKKEYSFERRAEELIEIAEKYGKKTEVL